LVYTVSVAAGGDVEIITGTFDFYEGIDLGDGPAGQGNGLDAYVARIDADGATIWSGRFGHDMGSTLEDVRVDAAGNTVLVGRTEVDRGLSIWMGDEWATFYYEGIPTDLPAGFVIKLSPAGAYIFGQEVAAPVSAVTVDASGAMILAGGFQGTIDLGGGPLTSGNNNGEMWIAKLDPGGHHEWSRQYAAPGVPTSIELGPAGDIHLTARVTGTADFGGGPLETESAQALVVVKLDPEGGHLWSKLFAEPSFVTEAALAVDDAGRVSLSGSTDGPVRFGGEELVNGSTMALFAAQLDPSGEPIRAGFFGCSSGFSTSLTFRSGVSEGVALAAPFRRFAGLDGTVTAGGTGVVVAGFEP
jgi:hypothetical protein